MVMSGIDMGAVCDLVDAGEREDCCVIVGNDDCGRGGYVVRRKADFQNMES